MDIHVGTKSGCITVIDEGSNKLFEYYVLQCKCGRIFKRSKDACFWELQTKHRDCGELCGLRAAHIKKIQDSYKRIKDDSWYWELENTYHESLYIEKCIKDDYEKLHSFSSRFRYGQGTFKVFKQYKCKCCLCGKEYTFISSDFDVVLDDYGDRAKEGYYSIAHCDCHEISSFQWRTLKILRENHIRHRAEVSFPGLTNSSGCCNLRFDFAIYNNDGTLKCLIECQGIQHYMPVEEFGGNRAFKIQSENYAIKRAFANENGFPLIEIPYTCNTSKKEERFLKKNGII